MDDVDFASIFSFPLEDCEHVNVVDAGILDFGESDGIKMNLAADISAPFDEMIYSDAVLTTSSTLSSSHSDTFSSSGSDDDSIKKRIIHTPKLCPQEPYKRRRRMVNDNSLGVLEEFKHLSAEEAKARRKAARLARNRESANRSRERRKEYLEELQSQVATLQTRVVELETRCEGLEVVNRELSRKLGEKGQSGSSSSLSFLKARDSHTLFAFVVIFAFCVDPSFILSSGSGFMTNGRVLGSVQGPLLIASMPAMSESLASVSILGPVKLLGLIILYCIFRVLLRRKAL